MFFAENSDINVNSCTFFACIGLCNYHLLANFTNNATLSLNIDICSISFGIIAWVLTIINLRETNRGMFYSLGRLSILQCGFKSSFNFIFKTNNKRVGVLKWICLQRSIGVNEPYSEEDLKLLVIHSKTLNVLSNELLKLRRAALKFSVTIVEVLYLVNICRKQYLFSWKLSTNKLNQLLSLEKAKIVVQHGVDMAIQLYNTTGDNNINELSNGSIFSFASNVSGNQNLSDQSVLLDFSYVFPSKDSHIEATTTTAATNLCSTTLQLQQYCYVFKYAAQLIDIDTHWKLDSKSSVRKRPCIYFQPFSTKLAFDEIEQVGVDLRAMEVAILEHPDSDCFRLHKPSEGDPPLIPESEDQPQQQSQQPTPQLPDLPAGLVGRDHDRSNCGCIAQRFQKQSRRIHHQLLASRLGVLLSIAAVLCFGAVPLATAIAFAAATTANPSEAQCGQELCRWISCESLGTSTFTSFSCEARKAVGLLCARIVAKIPFLAWSESAQWQVLIGNILVGKLILYGKSCIPNTGDVED